RAPNVRVRAITVGHGDPHFAAHLADDLHELLEPSLRAPRVLWQDGVRGHEDDLAAHAAALGNYADKVVVEDIRGVPHHFVHAEHNRNQVRLPVQNVRADARKSLGGAVPAHSGIDDLELGFWIEPLERNRQHVAPGAPRPGVVVNPGYARAKADNAHRFL